MPRVEITEEEVPCGICRKTSTYDESGTLVRRDIEIIVDASFTMTGEVNNGDHASSLR